MTAPGALPADLAEFLATLTDEEIDALGPDRRAEIVGLVERVRPASIERWLRIARASQLPPPGDWYLWVLTGGRGSGKTAALSHWLAGELIGDGPGDESAIVAPTFGDARDKDVEGPTGLLAALGTTRAEVDSRQAQHVEAWNRSLGELRMRNGAIVRIDGADDGGLRLQGGNYKRAVCAEIGLWRPGAGEQTWDESLLPAVRLGRPRIAIAGTPRPTPLMKRILQDPRAHVARMTTFENAANLAPEFIAEMKDRYEGTRLGRRELYGELLDDVEGALWRRAWIEENRIEAVPLGRVQRTVIGLDPSGGRETGAEQALVIVSATMDGLLVVSHVDAMRESPLEYLSRAVRLAVDQDAGLVLEANYGDRPMLELLDQAQRKLGVIRPVQVVKARTGKLTRAEPVASLSEQGKIKFAGHFPELEDELCGFTGAPGERSPDRLDAFVWACTALMAYARTQYRGDDANDRVVPYTDHPTGPDAAVPWEDANPDAGLGTFAWFAGRHGV